MSNNTFYNLRILEVDLKTGHTNLLKKDMISNKTSSELWSKHMRNHVGASTSNLGYEEEGCPEYHTVTGVIKDSSKVITWTRWNSKKSKI